MKFDNFLLGSSAFSGLTGTIAAVGAGMYGLNKAMNNEPVNEAEIQYIIGPLSLYGAAASVYCVGCIFGHTIYSGFKRENSQ